MIVLPNRRIRLLVSRLAIACLSVWLAMLSLADTARAQDEDSPINVRFMLGLEVMAMRAYEDSEKSDRDLMVMLFRYEDEPRATTAYPFVLKLFIEQMAGVEADFAVEQTAAPKVGDEASAYTLRDPDLGEAAMVVSREGRYVVAAFAVEPEGTIAEAQTQAMTVLNEIFATDESAAEVVVDESGASTGGIWGKLETIPSLQSTTIGPVEDFYVTEDELAEVRAPFEIAGLEGAVQRTYVTEDASFGDADGTPIADQPFALASIAAFADPASAASGFDQYVERWHAISYDTMDPRECGDLGERCSAFVGIGGSKGELGDMSVIVVQQGAYIFAVAYHGPQGEDFDVSRAFASVMLGQTISGDAVAFDPYGDSVGGLWDLYPAWDDPVLAGLVAEDDVTLLELPER